MDEPALLDLVSLARSGDRVACEELLRQFEHDVRLMVRVRLPRVLRAQFDSMDFVQAVWQSFFGDTSGPSQFDSPQHLRAYLAGVARLKVLEEYRRRTQTRKYALAREEPLYIRRGGRDQLREIFSRDPSPSQQFQAQDRLARIVAGRSPIVASVVQWRQEGRTFEEIAELTGLGERTLRRMIKSLEPRAEDRS